VGAKEPAATASVSVSASLCHTILRRSTGAADGVGTRSGRIRMDLSLIGARAPIDTKETAPEGGGELSETAGRPSSADPPKLSGEVTNAEGASDLGA
jgi:hypothetical protein